MFINFPKLILYIFTPRIHFWAYFSLEMAHFAEKYIFHFQNLKKRLDIFKEKLKNFTIIIWQVFFFLVSEFQMISLSKRQKKLWNWKLMKLEILIFRILEDKKCIFWQNEAFLVKTKLRFGIRGSKYIIWARGLSSDFGSLEFVYF